MKAYFVSADPQEVQITEEWRANRLLEMIFHGLRAAPGEDRFIRTGAFVPDVFSPGGAWILSERAAEALHRVDSELPMERVEFEKLIDYPLPEAEGYDAWEDPQSLFLDMPDVPRFHGEVGRFWVLKAPRLDELTPSFAVLTDKDRAQIYYSNRSFRQYAAEHLTRAMIAAHPVMDGYGSLVLSEGAFDALHPFINERHLAVHVVEVGE